MNHDENEDFLPELEEVPESETTEDEKVVKKPLVRNERTHRAEKKKNGFLVGGAAALTLVGLSLGSYYAYDWYSNKDNVAVPEATAFLAYGSEMTDEALCEDFVKTDLQCVVNWTTDENADRGNLLKQSVAVGEEVAPGTKVTLTYSQGPASSEFPNLTGQEVSESEEVLYEMGITVSEVKKVEGDGIPAGRIVSTSIDPGAKVENGTEVIINVSDGALEVPDWKGKSRDFVEVDAQNYGLTVYFVEETSDEAPGIVLSQDPPAGEITEESTITLNIAKPAEIVEVEVPDVINMSSDEAQSQLAVAGFTNIKMVSVNSASVDAPQVVEVVPGVGTKSSTNTQVVVVIATPEEASANDDQNTNESAGNNAAESQTATTDTAE